MKTLKKIVFTLLILAVSATLSFAFDYSGVKKPKKLDDLFDNANVVHYDGSKGIGINHIAYWTITDDEIDALFDPSQAEVEKAKKAKFTPNGISSVLYPPDDYDPIPGWEVTGTLTGGTKKNPHTQAISLVIPDDWNGKLIVLGTPGTRTEYGEASLMSPWLLERGYATIEGDKGMPNGSNDLLNETHLTQYWAEMMIDMAEAAQKTIKKATGMKPLYTYAAGMSNGGLQTRLALELDHARVMKEKKRGHKYWEKHGLKRGAKRLFDGGLAWSGSYYPRKEILDTNGDGNVTVEEYVEHAGITLFGALNKANLILKWVYDEASITNPANPGFGFDIDPALAFQAVQPDMFAMGFHPDSAQVWGAYNSNFDYYKNYAAIPGFESYWVWAGVGYLNLSSSLYLAEARGEGAADWLNYNYLNTSTYPHPPVEPTLYAYLEANADSLGFNQEAVDYFLKTANSADFSVPLIEIHGTKDSLVPAMGQGVAYRDAVEQYGNPELHRLYLLENGVHVEYQVDFGRVDYDFNGNPADQAVEGQVVETLTPMQGYAMQTMDMLEAWVEDGVAPVESGTVITDPIGDTVVTIEEANMDPLP